MVVVVVSMLGVGSRGGSELGLGLWGVVEGVGLEGEETLLGVVVFAWGGMHLLVGVEFCPWCS